MIEPPPPPNAGITVTVLDGNGWPIQGAYVQFLRHANLPEGVRQSNTFRTDANGVAFFRVAPADTYGINVTHPDFASTHETTRTITRNDRSAIQSEPPIIMREHSSTLRNLGWRNVLPDMHIQGNHQISSVYGRRRFLHNGVIRWEFHNGIDLVGEDHITTPGREIRSAFTGDVVQVFRNDRSRGHAATVRFRDRDTGIYYFMRYMHMQAFPQVQREWQWVDLNDSGSMTVNANERIGLVGTTGSSTSDHLHIDVQRQNTRSWDGSSWYRTIDPRAFFAPDFANPWPSLNVQP